MLFTFFLITNEAWSPINLLISVYDKIEGHDLVEVSDKTNSYWKRDVVGSCVPNETSVVREPMSIPIIFLK